MENKYRNANPLRSVQTGPRVCLSVDWCPELWNKARETALLLHIGLSQFVARALTQYLHDNNLPDDHAAYRIAYLRGEIINYNNPDHPDYRYQETD